MGRLPVISGQEAVAAFERAVLIPDPEDGGYIVTVPVLPGWLMLPVPSNERKGGKNFMRLPVTLKEGI